MLLLGVARQFEVKAAGAFRSIATVEILVMILLENFDGD
jgi:hypothetical protein